MSSSELDSRLTQSPTSSSRSGWFYRAWPRCSL